MVDPTPSTSAPEPAPIAGAPPGPPASARPHRRRWLVPVVALVVAVVLLAALVATGVVPLAKAPSSSPAFAPTFQGAASEGQSTANAAPDGPWAAALGVAFRVPLSLTLPTENLTGQVASVDGCNATLSPHLPTDVVVQGTPSTAGPGASAFWVVVYVNSSGGAVGVMVDGGLSSELFTLGGASCAKLTQYLVPFPSGSPDSPTILDAANTAGGSAFLAAHPNATQVFVGASVVLLEPVWEVVYTTCTLSPLPNTTGSEFNATVIGTTVENRTTGPVSCSLPSGAGLPTLGVPASGTPALGKAI